MNTQLRFSDIVRYFFVGGVTCFMIIVFNDFIIADPASTGLYRLMETFAGDLSGNNLLKVVSASISSGKLLSIVAVIAVMCFVGVVVQGLKMFVSYIPRWRKKSKRYAQSSWLIFLVAPLYLDVYAFSCVLKHYTKISVPSWIYLSYIPNKQLATLEDFLSQNTSDNIDGDMKFFNDCFSALAFVFYIMFLMTLMYYVVRSCALDTCVFCCGNLVLIFSLYALCSGLAALFAYKHINNIGSKCLACEKKRKKGNDGIGPLYNLYGSPVAFVLIRTHSKGWEDNSDKLYRALSSVAMQSYENIRIIVMEDVNDTVDASNTVKTIDKFVREQIEKTGKEDFASRVSWSRKECKGPAGAAYYAREMFLNIASENDVAIMLDDDDTLRREDSVLDIMTQMFRFNADICMSSFETLEEVELNICNNGGKTHNDIVAYLSHDAKRVPDVKGVKVCFASSIGWTKSYRYGVVEAYNKVILAGDRADKYKDLSRYEDFPDFLTLLKTKKGRKGFLITGVEEPTHLYHKSGSSITGNVSLTDFQNARPQFLAFTLQICQASKDIFIKDALKYAVTYVMFKEMQISNIIAKYRLEAKPNNIYEEFKDIRPLDFLKWVDEALSDMNVYKNDELKKAIRWAKNYIGVKSSMDQIDLKSLKKLNELTMAIEDGDGMYLRNAVYDLIHFKETKPWYKLVAVARNSKQALISHSLVSIFATINFKFYGKRDRNE